MIEVKDVSVPPSGTPPGRKQPSGPPQPAVGTRRTGSVGVTGTIRRILCVLPPPLVTVVAVRHRPVPAGGFAQPASARRPWLLAAAGATCPTWVAAAFTRQGAVPERLPATQFAAGAANRLLPTGLGASAVNPRFMTVCGLPPARSPAAPALYLPAESAGRVGLLGALSAGAGAGRAPGGPRPGSPPRRGGTAGSGTRAARAGTNRPSVYGRMSDRAAVGRDGPAARYIP